ncbi:cysteine and histidine-rich domain-containing protein morgana [Anopheles marshallii]|uniref:cysteine and histidine-rich domain-containing protein morgana n=1 Tax=Anopheles marshallii TaxID=1521116 RepID=UPI00237BB526|nr:cysteine and histidine-rich domain-containing protein morgana [Anopheles marshallii]
MPPTVVCYNRGCGQSFDPQNNSEDCVHHPGVPFFHDAYKGWTCCNKKSVDFTEFLNIKGCTRGLHSNEKPPEPEKRKEDTSLSNEAAPVEVKIREPIRPTMERPSFETALTSLDPWVAPAFRKQIDEMPAVAVKKKTPTDIAAIEAGAVCKHGGCSCTYEDAKTSDEPCVYHPGVPIFHEGMKFWSCCQRKTSDFTAFMNQAGCETGKHLWVSEEDESKTIKCRLDWHQTATTVVVTVYAKNYHYAKSYVRVNPIRLAICLVFPQQDGNQYNVDMELRGVIDVAQCKVQMFGTKVEITLVKGEAGTWANLDFPRAKSGEQQKQVTVKADSSSNAEDNDSDVDLEDLEPTMRTATITEVTE